MEEKRTYSYDPAKLSENGIDKMRFELGDTTFAPAALTAALCDEEYEAVLAENKRWKKAKIKCLEAILMRFSHQVNTSIDGISYSFSDRVKIWKEMLRAVKTEGSMAAPTANPLALNGGIGGQPYFYSDMQTNLRKSMPKNRKR